MSLQETSAMESASESEQISDSFVCAVCLDLLYKPIVLACGHVSCFWCVHKSMSFHRESHCPICRHAYQHFPSICQLLHFLLLKMYPVTCKTRKEQILEMEKATLHFSPDIDNRAASTKPYSRYDLSQPSTVNSQDSLSVDSVSIKRGETCANASQLETSSYGYSGSANSNEICSEGPKMFSPAAAREKLFDYRSIIGTCGQISAADVLCATCEQLLYRPVVLNCGHVYCEACIVIPSEGMLRCQVCESPHPRAFPKVCLELDHFLEEQFCLEYAKRKVTTQLKQVSFHKGNPTMGSEETSNLGSKSSSPTDDNFFQWLKENSSSVHAAVGCDSCGMMPIIGERYRCKDCKEKMGFDLCGGCYNTRSKLPGRFNQQHTPEHQMEAVKPQSIMRLFKEQLVYAVAAAPSTAAVQSQEIDFPSSDSEDGPVSPGSPSNGIEDQSNNHSSL